MKITVVGAGPAGLYFAILMKRSDPTHDITVIERNAADVTFGWGVVFSEDTLTELRDADYPSFLAFDEALVRWSAIDIRYRDRTVRSYGHGFSAISRARLLGILQQRAADLGVQLSFQHELSDLSDLDDADLIVGADGVRSTVRAAHEEHFRTTFDPLGSRYVWFGTDLVFDVFTFIFTPTEHGLFQVHGYPFDGQTSTFIVETTEQTWRNAGLDRMTEDESMGFCSELFAEHLGDHKLLSNASVWRTFDTIRNRSWHHGNVVIMGDAAHTAHFSIGSGTKLAIEDAVALAKAFQAHPDNLPAAFAEYELERQTPVERFQEAATDSARYFEQVSRYLHFEPEQFAFNLLTRSGRITHANLELRDPAITNLVDRWLAGRPQRVVTTPPVLTEVSLGPVVVPNRVVIRAPLTDTSRGGLPGAEHVAAVERAAQYGAGLVITDPVAISEHGRITPASVGCWDDRHAEAWADISSRVHDADALLGLRLCHAGRRGATHPRDRGIDRPLRTGAWTTLAPSAVPYAPWLPPPAAVDAQRFAEVREEFVTAARLAARAGVDVLVLDCSDGYLLASFLSPLANQRDDDYGTTAEGRLRYPLEILDAVREVWPQDRGLGVRLVVDDRHPKGLAPADGVGLARAFAQRGADAIDVAAGLSIGTDAAAGEYRRLYQVALADRVRNEAGVPAVASGRITTLDEINTVVAAGRADLCTLDVRAYA